jgi:hypothetical protein
VTLRPRGRATGFACKGVFITNERVFPVPIKPLRVAAAGN